LLVISAALLLAAMAAPPLVHEHAEATIPKITIHAKRFEFTPSEITMKVEQPTKLIFISDDVSHGISVEGLLSDVTSRTASPQRWKSPHPRLATFRENARGIAVRATTG